MTQQQKQDLKRQLARLRNLSLSELRGVHLEAFGEPTRSGNKEFLLKRIAWRLQSVTEGGLSERARQRAAELARDADLRLTVPTMRAAPDLPPAEVHGGRLGGRDEGLPPPGSVLTRTYRNRTIVITVLPKGFEWEGTVYRSLSAVAKAITGSHWNGRLFFNLPTNNKGRGGRA
jgi:hypothetical protein